MRGKEHECKDCGRAFQVTEGERVPKCPGCESENVAPKKRQTLPDWVYRENKAEGG
jgi:predicted Zn-ribbon and HTH transcriptional regulator